MRDKFSVDKSPVEILFNKTETRGLFRNPKKEDCTPVSQKVLLGEQANFAVQYAATQETPSSKLSTPYGINNQIMSSQVLGDVVKTEAITRGLLANYQLGQKIGAGAYACVRLCFEKI